MISPDDAIVETVKLSRPAQRALAQAGLACFADLARWRRDDVAALHGIGPKSFVALDPAMEARSLRYKSP